MSQTSQKAPATGFSRMKNLPRETSRLFFITVCSVITAGLFYISYPDISFSFAAWLMLAPFVWGVCHVRSVWGSFFYGWLTGFLSHAALLSWIYYTCLHGGGLSHGLALGAWLGLSALLAMQFAVLGGACHFLKKTGAFFPLLTACGWVALEWLHQTIAFYALGFPWIMLGYTQWNVPDVLYIASFAGVYGLSFLLAFVGAGVGWCFALPGLRKGLWHLGLATLIFAGVYGLGHHMQVRYAHFAQHPHSLLSVQSAILQPNIDQYKKWTPQYEDEIAQTLQSLGSSLADKGLYLAVWPESAVPGALSEERYFNLFSEIAAKSGAYQIIGSNITSSTGRQYVGAYLLSPAADSLSAYRKIKLVPFGEFIPFESLVKRIFTNVEVLGALGSFTPGEVEQPLLEAGGIKLGTTICYESIFPQLARSLNQRGAQLFVNITNDAWFFNTAAPHQHLAANVLRAVENGRPLCRAANTGFSADSDAFGHVQTKSGLFTQEFLTAQVPLSVRNGTTLYGQWGDWFAWLCAILFFTIAISTAVFWYE